MIIEQFTTNTKDLDTVQTDVDFEASQLRH